MLQPIGWFTVTLVLAILYGMRIRLIIGRVSEPLWRWHTAFVFSGSVIVTVLLFARTGVEIQHDVGVGLHAIIMWCCAIFGIRYWTRMPGMDTIAVVSSFLLVGAHLCKPVWLNNIMLVLTALGLSVIGYHVTKTWVRVLFGALAVFDVYAVWYSDIMEVVFSKYPGVFPVQFIVLMQANLPFIQIGSMDVILAALATVAIQRHRGVRRSIVFAGGCIVCSVGIGTLADSGYHLFQTVPFLVFLAPLVFSGLAGPRAMALPVHNG